MGKNEYSWSIVFPSDSFETEHRAWWPGFPPTLENLENLEKWDNFFQSGKSQGILKKY